MTEIHEIADGIYRVSTFIPQINLAFTQFVIKDQQPLLFHTGQRGLFQDTLEAVKKVIDPRTLRYISWSHLEADECGAANDFLAVAPQAEPVQGQLGVMLSVGDFFTRPVVPVTDDGVLDLGQHKLRFMLTPHVPHAWDAVLVYEETTGTLLTSDLFTQSGERAATTSSDIVGRTLETHKLYPDYLPVGPHTARVFDRLEALSPRVLAGHHGPAYTGDAV